MSQSPWSSSSQLATPSLHRGKVLRVEQGVIVVVSDSGVHRQSIRCAALRTSPLRMTISPGDVVLYLLPEPEVPEGIVLGRVEPYSERPDAQAVNLREPNEAELDEVPTELVIEARQSLVLRVGDGSITISGDGRILISGKDLVSQAKRRNRIRGGSVEIN